LVQQENRGVAAARNRAIAESRGEFIAPVDGDDIWFPEAVTKLVDCFLTTDSRTGVVYGWSVIIDEDGLLDGRFRCSKIEGEVLRTLICHNFLGNASSTMIRRTCLEKVGGYDLGFRANGVQGCEDWDLYLRIAENYSFRVVPEFLFGYRKARVAMSSNPASMAKSHRYLLEKMKEKHPQIPGMFCRLSLSSYYLRFAREYHHDRQPAESLAWLVRALASSPVLTLLRIGFYSLILRNLAALFWKSISRSFPPPSRSSASTRAIQIKDVKKKRAAIALQLAAQSVLHRMVLWLSRS
jgi:glycosyltransferase involved in cell wall biosynthesis